MRNRVVLALAAALSLAAFSGLQAADQKKNAAEAQTISQADSRGQKILQALNRLTFGPRPGDVAGSEGDGPQEVDRSAASSRADRRESRCSTEKLKIWTRCTMSGERTGAQLSDAADGPKQMINGRLPFPTDPDRKLMLTRMVEKYEKRQAAGGDPQCGAQSERAGHARR